MQQKISMDLVICNSEDKISLDEIVQSVSSAYENRAFAELVKLILCMIQEIVIGRILSKSAAAPVCCEHGHLSLNGHYHRRIRTSIGDVALYVKKVKCSVCGRSFAPLPRHVNIGKYQTKSNEFEPLVVETVAETSYRRRMAQLARDGKNAPPFRTANSWTLRTDCDEIQLPADACGVVGAGKEKQEQPSPLKIFADGTRFKGEGRDGKARKGELKAVIGVNEEGDVLPLGTYSDMSWPEISQEWKERKIKLPAGSILVCDGELGLADAFADYVDDIQRCQWHTERDLYHAMRQDGGNTKSARPYQKRLAGIMSIELPKEDFQKVSEDDRKSLEGRMGEAEEKVQGLIDELSARGYQKAADYLFKAKLGMFGYVRRWLKWGLVSPRASSLIERVMRELGRRIKRIAYGWSDRGVEKIAKIILKRHSDPEEWRKYWEKRNQPNGKVMAFVQNYRCSSTNFAH